MTVQKLIDELQKVEDKTLPVCKTSYHEYWGTCFDEIESVNLNPNAQPDGPKKPSRTSIVLD